MAKNLFPKKKGSIAAQLLALFGKTQEKKIPEGVGAVYQGQMKGGKWLSCPDCRSHLNFSSKNRWGLVVCSCGWKGYTA